MARRVLARVLGWDESTVQAYEVEQSARDAQRQAQLRAVLGDPPGWMRQAGRPCGARPEPCHPSPRERSSQGPEKGASVRRAAGPQARRTAPPRNFDEGFIHIRPKQQVVASD